MLTDSMQGAGFVASSGALVGIAVYSILTGLLLAEVNLNTMCDIGSGGVSLVRSGLLTDCVLSTMHHESVRFGVTQ